MKKRECDKNYGNKYQGILSEDQFVGIRSILASRIFVFDKFISIMLILSKMIFINSSTITASANVESLTRTTDSTASVNISCIKSDKDEQLSIIVYYHYLPHTFHSNLASDLLLSSPCFLRVEKKSFAHALTSPSVQGFHVREIHPGVGIQWFIHAFGDKALRNG